MEIKTEQEEVPAVETNNVPLEETKVESTGATKEIDIKTEIKTETNEEASKIETNTADVEMGSMETDNKSESTDEAIDTEEQVVAADGNRGLTDEYHYLKTGEYTTEIYKVVVKNVPGKLTYGVRNFVPWEVLPIETDFKNSREYQGVSRRNHNKVIMEEWNLYLKTKKRIIWYLHFHLKQ